MKCPSCSADNPPTATACRECQVAMTPRKRRRSDAAEVSPKTEEYDRQVRRIFHVCLASMIPFVGLVLGPLGAIRAYRFLVRSRPDPLFQAELAAKTAVLVGVLTGVSNWLGLGLILLGLLLP